MATSGRRSTDPLKPHPDQPLAVVERLFARGFEFDFFQAVRLLQAAEPERVRVGLGGPPPAEVVRFRSLASLSFPPSSIHDLTRGTEVDRPAVMTQPFLGLTGPNGVLPRHYTELLIRLGIERRDTERYALRDWFDLFNHRFTSLIYRAWEKYRLFLDLERPRRSAGIDQEGPSPFEASLLSLIGLGTPALRDRLVARLAGDRGGSAPGNHVADPSPARRIDDSTLIFYAGLIRMQTRSAAGLEAILRHHFGLEIRVLQFQGRWLSLEEPSQSRLRATEGQGSRLGVNTVLGERVWDIQGFFRVQIGPLTYPQFAEFLPERNRANGTHGSFLAAQLVRFYVGPELDFDLQLVLRADEVPRCQLAIGQTEGPILGWNSWLANDPMPYDPGDAAFSNTELDV